MFIQSKMDWKEIELHVAQAYPFKTRPSSLSDVCLMLCLVAVSLNNGLGEI